MWLVTPFDGALVSARSPHDTFLQTDNGLSYCPVMKDIGRLLKPILPVLSLLQGAYITWNLHRREREREREREGGSSLEVVVDQERKIPQGNSSIG
jgi:hypothetical protein